MDELLQLSDVYKRSLPDTVARVARNPGGVPLTYVAENIFVNALGHPLYHAHLFSILCAIAGMASLMWLVRLLGSSTTWPVAAFTTYALLPISLRYAIEARQYGPALATSICATALVVWLDQQPSWWRALLYSFVLILGLYSQPYIAFIAAAHLLWALNRPKSRTFVVAACALAALLFLPWYLYARAFWVNAVTAGGYQSSLDWKTPLMILRELSGGGYFLSIAFVALAIRGYQRAHRLLLFCIIVPIPLVLAANAWAHYFFAIRQLLFIVPPLCVLAAQGLCTLPKPWRPALAATLAVIVLIFDIHWFANSKDLSPIWPKDLLLPRSAYPVTLPSAK
jgi:uncharacterized membrane protein